MPLPEFNTPEYAKATTDAIESSSNLLKFERSELEKAVDELLGNYVKDNPIAFFYVNIIRHLNSKEIRELKKLLTSYSSTP